MCVGFFFLFFGFFASQNFVTTALGDAGDLSLGLLYGTFAACALAAPAGLAAMRWGPDNLAAERNALVLGSAFYAPFLFACSNSSWRSFQLGGSLLLGAGAGAVWVAQGSLLTKCSEPSQRASLAGVFWAWYMGGNCLGNVAATFIEKTLSLQGLFVSLGLVTLLSSAIFAIGVQPRSRLSETDSGQIKMAEQLLPNMLDGPKAHTVPPMQAFAGLFFKRHTLFLVPALLFIGSENSFWAGAFTKIISQHGATDSIGPVLSCLAAADMLSSIVAGRISDWCARRQPANYVGRTPPGTAVLGVGVCVFLMGLVLLATRLLLTPDSFANGAPIEAFVCAVCFGVGDGVTNTVVISRLGSLAEDRGWFAPEVAFMFFQSVNVAATSAAFFYAPVLPLDTSFAQLWILGALGLATLGSYALSETVAKN